MVQSRSSAYATASSVGPMNTPRKPNASAPPSTPSMIQISGMPVPLLISSGLTMLSAMLTTATPHTTRKMAQPVAPVWYSHSAAGSHTSGGPTGITDRKKVTKPRMAAPGTPAIHRPMPARTAWMKAVPSTP
ncbi:hypothetical protein D3C72_1472430 [compost metagenome]